MNVLVVGGGGREHAVCWKLLQSPGVGKLYCAPGNGGIAEICECVDIGACDIGAMVDFAKRANVDLCFVAPDDPLALGMVDEMEKNGIRAFGPKANAAIIESSKVFSKWLMKKYNIPTAEYEAFDDCGAAVEYARTKTGPFVVKADGLALGKGVIICKDADEGVAAINGIMGDKVFGDAGRQIVIEEFLSGTEVTVLAFCDGTTILPMASSKDHKRAFDNDMGLNTGGMGAISPLHMYTDEIHRECTERIFVPTVEALKAEGREFKGVIYFGLMMTEGGVKVIEYNARFGDPEAQVVLPRMENDLLDIVEACIDGTLDKHTLKFSSKKAACVCLVSGGYPEKYEKGFPVTGVKDCSGLVFCAGVDKGMKTAGGRVLGVVGMHEDLGEAVRLAYEDAAKIKFSGMHYRKDIGNGTLA